MSERVPEIVIVKRNSDDEDGHHGGAWKIALADFMTAMMALFLVMWLINSTSKEQRQTIAEYFNPVKLAEVTHDRKGLNDPQDVPNDPAPAGRGNGAEGETGQGTSEAARGTSDAASALGSRARESALFQDPYAVLAKLAAEADAAPAASSADVLALEAGQPGMAGGETGRDPFDPLYWQVAALPQRRTETPGPLDTTAAVPFEARLDAKAQSGGLAVRDGRKPNDPSKEAAQQSLREAMKLAGLRLASVEPLPSAKEAVVKESAPEAVAGMASSGSANTGAETPPPEAGDQHTEIRAAPINAPVKAGNDAKAAETAAVATLKAEIARAVQPLAQGDPAPNVEVRRIGEGVLISITDGIQFSMFGIGSAEPTPKVVKALERIAKLLDQRPGRIVVRGHTDGRPFKSETYDNWRLSSARAQMAAYMLVRGGVDEARIERVEGHADRLPRIAADRKAAENRRIEILLRGSPE